MWDCMRVLLICTFVDCILYVVFHFSLLPLKSDTLDTSDALDAIDKKPNEWLTNIVFLFLAVHHGRFCRHCVIYFLMKQPQTMC